MDAEIEHDVAPEFVRVVAELGLTEQTVDVTKGSANAAMGSSTIVDNKKRRTISLFYV